jgi:deoxyribonuclease V
VDFYSALKDLVDQIPAGKIVFLGDIAEALGDKAAAVALPRALARIGASCDGVKRVLRADGSPIIPGTLAALKRAGVKVSGSFVEGAGRFAFREFSSDRPLRRLRSIQYKSARRVVLRDGVRKPRTIAGVDVAYRDDHAIAAAVLMDAKTLHIIAEAVAEVEVTFPYIPGYLAFRELPPLLAALRSLPSEPSLLFVDGHGILHPAKCGIAAQVGVTAKIPTIGVGKSYLTGEIDSKTIKKGAAVPVRIGGRIMGYAFRSSESRHPIFISPGNMMTPKTALRLTRAVCLSRVPEPIRQAHVIATEKRKEKNDL